MAGNIPLDEARIRAILLDIEGTTTPIEFVHDVLFPYARENVKAFVQLHLGSEELRRDVALLRAEHAADEQQGLDPPAWHDDSMAAEAGSVVAYVQWLKDRDRKSTGLKSLQGRIWENGYRSGKLRAQVYPDVLPAFERWERQGKTICIFSSGSVLAQQLLFAHTDAGDLGRYIVNYFDTTTGPKVEAESYRRIASAMDRAPAEVVFVSDVAAELDAAAKTGMQAILCARPGHTSQGEAKYPAVASFADLLR